jgi:hypothetical protein
MLGAVWKVQMDKLYRFFSLGYKDDEIQTAKKMIVKGEFDLKKPSEFNDPFDCKPRFAINLQDGNESDVLCEQLKKENSYCGHAGATSLLDDLKSNSPKIERVTEVLESQLSQNLEKTRMLCFSSTLNEMLLWPHYSNGHKGYCLEFDFGKLKEYLDKIGNFEQVRYKPNYPILRFATPDPLENLKAILYTKSKSWEYEEEWRLVIVDESVTTLIPANCITAIYLGNRIAAPRYDDFLGIFEEAHDKFKIYKMELDKNKYDITPKLIKEK